MAPRLPFEVVRGAAALSLASAPLLCLGAALSKMDSPERYYAQLAVVSATGVLSLVCAVGAILGKSWFRPTLVLFYWTATGFWLWAAMGLHDALPLLIAAVLAAIALALHFAESSPTAGKLTTSPSARDDA